MTKKLEHGNSKAFYLANENGELRATFSQDTIESWGLVAGEPIGWFVPSGHPHFILGLTQDIDYEGTEPVGIDMHGQRLKIRPAYYPHKTAGRFNIRLITTLSSKGAHPIPHDMPEDGDTTKWELVVSTFTSNGKRYVEVRFLDVSSVVVRNLPPPQTLGDL